MSAAASSCRSCNAALPGAARFCPACGTSVDAEPATVGVQRVEPQLFGVLSPLAAFGLGAGALLLAVFAFVMGEWLVGVVLLLPALALLALFVESGRRFGTNDPVSRSALTAVGRARAWSGFAAGSASAWSKAGRELVVTRRELAAIRSERESAQHELGGAAYRDDTAEVERLRARLKELDERAAGCERRIEAALAQAKRRVGQERVAIQPTAVIEAERTDPDEQETKVEQP